MDSLTGNLALDVMLIFTLAFVWVLALCLVEQAWQLIRKWWR